ncbi:RDD family protein [Cellulomonas marina]|uniref:Uncharacterized membrane protein YckC, RDD family n=1 Tax=Cellulomonas marina TaxID=988821 RepID=A0A1I1AHW6_9CELL|nr:RDD family protein [Cellulomonas marina]GIG30198.1 hypothetical protein Cma02nite_27980 [Cellulomonas marina]SFB37072.1 Uncharacterized membrane protein YckC, RDD family [Cellulomonas marina]
MIADGPDDAGDERRPAIAGLDSRRRRLAARVLDAVLLAGVTWWVAGDGVQAPLPTSVVLPPFVLPAGPTAPGPWVALAVLLVLQGLTGQTPGKRLLDVAVVDDTTHRPVGVVRVLLRQLAHLLDGFLLLGYVRAAVNPERRTFADSLARTLVVRGGSVVRNRGPFAPVAARRVTVAALVVVVLGAGFTVPWSTTVRTSDATALACSSAGGAVVGTAATTDAATSLTQWRWWVRRTSPLAPTTVRWSWPDDAFDGRLVGVHTTVRDAAGALVGETTLGGDPAEFTWEGSPFAPGGAIVSLDRAGAPAGGWRLASTLKVDDEVVANCRLALRATET